MKHIKARTSDGKWIVVTAPDDWPWFADGDPLPEPTDSDRYFDTEEEANAEMKRRADVRREEP